MGLSRSPGCVDIVPPKTTMATTIEEKIQFFKGAEQQKKERPLHLNRGLSFSQSGCYTLNLAASSRAVGSTSTDPSGKTIVGTLLAPLFTFKTISAALSSSSILMYS